MLYWLNFIILITIAIVFYKISYKSFEKNSKFANKQHSFAMYVVLWITIPNIIILILGSYIIDSLIYAKIISLNIDSNTTIEYVFKNVLSVALQIKNGATFDTIKIFDKDPQKILFLAQEYLRLQHMYYIILIIISTGIITAIGFITLNYSNRNKKFHKSLENAVKNTLMIFATIAVLTTFAIVLSLFIEAFKFFQHIHVLDFLFGFKWAPEEYEVDPENSFGIIPLIVGTLLIAFIAVFIAIIIGVSCAIYMSEYMGKKARKIIKPILEILAGIPSIVYGFFAATICAPIIVSAIDSVFNISISSENALSASIVMGIMILPFISSISDDMLRSIPTNIREGALGMGSMKYEMIIKILIPTALPGIIGAILLATSRAIGETMIVVMASSLSANLTINPLEPVTTITTQIAMLVQGDQEFNSPKTLSAFALAFVLLIITLILNIIAIKIVNKYREKYD